MDKIALDYSLEDQEEKKGEGFRKRSAASNQYRRNFLRFFFLNIHEWFGCLDTIFRLFLSFVF